ncbi:MAG: glycogen/starch synthase [Bacteroidota bacterium]
MKILHISAECYPAAKAGGLGDVVGALPKYLNQAGTSTAVVIPKYHTRWILSQEFTIVYRGRFQLYQQEIPFHIELLTNDSLGFPLYVANIPGKFDRPGVYADDNGYAYGDEVERAIAFQKAVLEWVMQMPEKPELLHCHDHHTGLVPFLVKHCYDYQLLANIPTVFTIHNGEYHGSFFWNKMGALPAFDGFAGGLLEWNGVINPLASAIKCCWKLTTVSQSYMEELRQSSNGLEGLLRAEIGKSTGILNGIDLQVWNPATDHYLDHRLEGDRIDEYKRANKLQLCDRFGLNPDLPLFTFIGRLVGEKGADLLPGAISRFLQYGHQASFIVLGTGQAYLHDAFNEMRYRFSSHFNASLEYNEGLAHQLYAGADFLLMPSRVEPCGLNQLYALRYGTVPVVRSVGGLRDTITDMDQANGSGIRFSYLTVDDTSWAIFRATELYGDFNRFKWLRNQGMGLDYSWEKSAATYQAIYQSLQEKAEVESI